jgi:hypothetical protein
MNPGMREVAAMIVYALALAAFLLIASVGDAILGFFF